MLRNLLVRKCTLLDKVEVPGAMSLMRQSNYQACTVRIHAILVSFERDRVSPEVTIEAIKQQQEQLCPFVLLYLPR